MHELHSVTQPDYSVTYNPHCICATKDFRLYFRKSYVGVMHTACELPVPPRF